VKPHKVTDRVLAAFSSRLVGGDKLLSATCSHACIFLGLFFDRENGSGMFLRNVD
jgi:hypothetical protein